MSNFIRQKSLQIVQKLTLKEGKLSLFPSFFIGINIATYIRQK